MGNGALPEPRHCVFTHHRNAQHEGPTMTAPTRITRTLDGTRGRYVARIDGIEGEAEITTTVLAPDRISADHTEAPASMRGTGVALALVEFMVADARHRGFRIVPDCPYVRAQFDKHPDWQDVRAA